MFCNSESWNSAICRPEPCSRPLVMEAFYFLYSPFPLFTGVRGRGFLGSTRPAQQLLSKSKNTAIE
jgi:hypothetical protein